jgi:hypothetical protein
MKCIAVGSTERRDLRLTLGNTYQQGIVPNTSLNNTNSRELHTKIQSKLKPDSLFQLQQTGYNSAYVN